MISEQKNSNKNFDAGENDVGDFRILKAVSHPFLLIIRKQLLAKGRNGIGYNKTANNNDGNTENRRTMDVQRKTVLIEPAFQPQLIDDETCSENQKIRNYSISKKDKQGRAQGPYGFHNSIRLAQQ